MHGYSGHAHKLVKDDGSFVYAQVRFRPVSLRNFKSDGFDPDSSITDVINLSSTSLKPKEIS
jgi:hypothetical protein